MSLPTPSKIRELQNKLYRKAKNEARYRFYLLYDKIWREDILAQAYEVARANQGAPGVDGESFEQIETGGRQQWLNGLREELRHKRYVYHGVRQFLRRRHRVPSRGTRRFSDEVVFGELRVLRLRRVQLGTRS
jgi:RNA-directed DNA polymerase